MCAFHSDGLGQKMIIIGGLLGLVDLMFWRTWSRCPLTLRLGHKCGRCFCNLRAVRPGKLLYMYPLASAKCSVLLSAGGNNVAQVKATVSAGVAELIVALVAYIMLVSLEVGGSLTYQSRVCGVQKYQLTQ